MPTALNIAKQQKIDDFYSLIEDIENELIHYKKFLEGKSIYCCCDRPLYSNFYKFLCNHYDDWNIKEVICSCKSWEGRCALVAVKDSKSKEGVIYDLEGDGSYDSEECLKYFLRADVVITNPPFSLAQEFIKYLISLEKKFVIVCNRNTIATKKIFPLFMNGSIKYGYGFHGRTAKFFIPPYLYGFYSDDVVRGEQNIVRFRNAVWLTNYDVEIPAIKREYRKKYSARRYPKYDQYDAINIDKITDIPKDYYDVMGVPITFLEGFDYDEFELLGMDRFMPLNKTNKRFSVKGKEKYARILIKRKKSINELQI